MNVDNLSSLKQFLFGGFGKVHTPAKASPVATQTSFSTMLNHARKTQPHGAGHGATPNLIEDVMAAADPQKAENAQVALLDSKSPTVPSGKRDAKAAAMVALEGTLMTKLVDQMLPKSNHALYGSGMAGDTWRGFQVDQFGAALAKSDPLHLVPTESGVKLAASAGVANLFGSEFDAQEPGRSITPFSS
jgi:hypothetical protein